MPCASLLQVLPAWDTAGLRQEFIALTFLGSFGWISLLNPFLPAAPQIVASFFPCRPSVPRHENSSNRLGTKSSRRSSVKIPGETSRTMLPSDRTLLALHWRFFHGRLGGDLADRQQMKVIFRSRKRLTLISSRFSGNWISTRRAVMSYAKLPIMYNMIADYIKYFKTIIFLICVRNSKNKKNSP